MVACRAILLLPFISIVLQAAAQPTLPDIAGIAQNGAVTLTWNCQYNSVRSVNIFRTADSTGSYKLVGEVDEIGKGVQTFTDRNPAAGKNCYKVGLVFKSGLAWQSNHYCVMVQKYVLESDRQFPMQPAAGLSGGQPHQTENKPPPVATQPPKPGGTPPVPTVKLKLPVAANDTIENPSLFIRSKYIYLDDRTGHVDVYLGDDVTAHHYSVKFYDRQNRIIMEVPHLHSSQVIIDKRNFQRKGLYKFVLRKDGLELEEGYVTPAP